MQRRKYTVEQKLELMDKYVKSGLGSKAFGKANGLAANTVLRWIEQYERLGVDGLTRPKHQQGYSAELKRQAVIAYILGQWPATKVLKHFGIRGISQLEDWVRQYNGNKELTDTPSARRVPKMARKTTYEERVEIAEYALAHQRNYKATAEKFNVTYQQVYLWVKKVDADGFPALVDRRGRTKSTDEMTELEKANLRIRQLEAQVKSADMEVAFAKKLKEILERGR